MRMINRLWRAGACPAVAVLVVAVTAAALLCAAPQAQAQRASTIIVLDGSNSMNARLPNDKVFKFVTVREALRTTLPTLSAGTEVGLTTFGARRLSALPRTAAYGMRCSR